MSEQNLQNLEATPSQAQRESRVGKLPIELPSGVQFSVAGDTVSLQGPAGKLEAPIPSVLEIKQKRSKLRVHIRQHGPDALRLQGLTRSLVAGMVEGAAKGFTTSLDLYGVGYKAEVAGDLLTMALGLSHQVKMKLPPAVKGRVETIDEGGQKRPRLHLTSPDKELLGHVVAKVRAYRPPEPYKGKGIRLTGERVRQKAGKAAAKAKA